MFKRICIEMTAPFCTCWADEVDLAWGIRWDDQGLPGLDIKCKNCGTMLQISNEKFQGRFSLDQSYPKRAPGPKTKVVHLHAVEPEPEPEPEEEAE